MEVCEAQHLLACHGEYQHNMLHWARQSLRSACVSITRAAEGRGSYSLLAMARFTPVVQDKLGCCRASTTCRRSAPLPLQPGTAPCTHAQQTLSLQCGSTPRFPRQQQEHAAPPKVKVHSCEGCQPGGLKHAAGPRAADEMPMPGVDTLLSIAELVAELVILKETPLQSGRQRQHLERMPAEEGVEVRNRRSERA